MLNGAINGRTFLAYVQQMLAPTLRPSDTVVMDSLGIHKVAGVHEAIEARGASLLYLPAYNPDLDPIELAFSKLKRLLRAETARTVDALWDAIGRLLDRFGPDSAPVTYTTAAMHGQVYKSLLGQCRGGSPFGAV